jgi:hypothetical protein
MIAAYVAKRRPRSAALIGSHRASRIGQRFESEPHAHRGPAVLS